MHIVLFDSEVEIELQEENEGFSSISHISFDSHIFSSLLYMHLMSFGLEVIAELHSVSERIKLHFFLISGSYTEILIVIFE